RQIPTYPERGVEFLVGLRQLSGIEISGRQALVGLGEVRSEGEGALELLDRFRRLATRHVHDAEIERHFRILGEPASRFPKLALRFRKPIQGDEGVSEVDPGGAELGLKTDRLLELIHRLRRPAGGLESAPEVVSSGSI